MSIIELNVCDEVDILAQKIWNYHHIDDDLKSADCILGLGSYDLRVAERCAELYFDNLAPFIVFSGGLGNWTEGFWDKPEAQMFKEHILHRGIPAAAIKTETQSTNIGENIQFTKELLSRLGLQMKSIILVTKPNTTRRAYATFKKVWENVDVIVTSPRLEFRTQPGNFVTKTDLINEMVGDLQRIRDYPALGYQIPQSVPKEVWQAYEKLVSLGHDKHLIKNKLEL